MDVGVLPEMRATHVKGFLSRGLQASCPGESVVCVDGMMAGDVTCQVACAGECCIGEYSFFTGAGPCTGFNGTLCKDIDTPPCSGRRACVNANIDLVVQGCNDDFACDYANIGTVIQGCNADSACYEANIYAIFQGCNEDLACAYANIGSVSYGCDAKYACEFANIGSVSYACNEYLACYDARIGSVYYACNALDACRRANIPTEDVSYCERLTEETLPDECTTSTPGGIETPESIIESECPCSSE